MSNDIQKALKSYTGDIEKRINYISGEIPLEKILTPSFFKKHTKFKDLTVFANNSTCSTSDMFVEYLENGDLDSYISDNSSFNSWNEMYKTAAEEYLLNNLK